MILDNRILFITCMPIEKPKTASMVFMGVLLEKYKSIFSWFSLRPPLKNSNNTFEIPYNYTDRVKRLTFNTNLGLFVNYFLWPHIQAVKAARFGSKQKCNIVWTDIAFKSIITGRLTAKYLNAPLFINIHDDPVNRLKLRNLPDWFLEWYKNQFIKTLKASEKVSVISDYMGEIYQKRYGVTTTTLFIGVETEKCFLAIPFDRDKKQIVIGSVGSMNCPKNWDLLLNSVKMLNEKYKTRYFLILHIGNLDASLLRSQYVIETGWLPEKEYLNYLAKIDIGFLNWSFDPLFEDSGRLSFPLKIHSYIQAQKPMLAIGPRGSSVIRFVSDKNCGICCLENNSEILSQCIEKLIFDTQDYERALNGLRELKREFSRELFFKPVRKFFRHRNK